MTMLLQLLARLNAGLIVRQSMPLRACVARERFDVMISEARQAILDFELWICREPDRGFVRRCREFIGIHPVRALTL